MRFIDGVGYVDIPDEKSDWYDVPSDEMTLEQARQAVKGLRRKLAGYLFQEPCTDAISRQAVMDALCDGCELFKNGEQTCFSKCEEYHFLATLPSVTPQPKLGYISIDDVMSVFDDFMCGEVDEEGTDTFLEMLKDKAESEEI